VTAEHAIARCRAEGDDVAFERTLGPLLHPAYELACAVLRDGHAAEDAVQESALRAWRAFGSLRDPGKARAWFLKIVLNECRSTMRGRWWRRHVLSDTVDAEVGGHERVADLRIDLERALRHLTHEQRAVLFLFFQLDLPQEEVAAILGVRVGTIKSRTHRAIAALRTAVGPEDPV
jgi:RNA polymerase sigma-70 factor, ECF subfamily